MKKIKMGVATANIMLLITAFLWGSGFVSSEVVMRSMTAMQLIFGRMVVACLVINIVFWKKVKTINKQDIIGGLAAGVCMFIGSALQNYGLTTVTSSVSAFVTTIYVVMIPFIKAVFFKHKPNIYSNIGAVLTVAGVGMISLNGFQMSIGVIVTLLAAVFFALEVIAIDEFTKKVDPIKLTIVLMNSNFVLGFFGSAYDTVTMGHWPEIGTVEILNVLYLGLICSFVANTFQSVAQKHTIAVQAAIIMGTESVFGALLSVIILHESITVRLVLGGIMIFLAIVISETKLKFMKKAVKTVH
ncbi:MAG: DMT family transporter [Clostridiales bacterium]|jgi:drug/metabolite transporter (DMT)-like permease|nr:DMT family transporter [Clostridiales bacterium]